MRNYLDKSGKILALGLGVYCLYTLATGMTEILWYRAVFVTIITSLCFLYPRYRLKSSRTFTFMNALSGIVCLVSGGYLLLNYERIINRIPMLSPVENLDILAGTLIMLLLLQVVK